MFLRVCVWHFLFLSFASRCWCKKGKIQSRSIIGRSALLHSRDKKQDLEGVSGIYNHQQRVYTIKAQNTISLMTHLLFQYVTLHGVLFSLLPCHLSTEDSKGPQQLRCIFLVDRPLNVDRVFVEESFEESDK